MRVYVIWGPTSTCYTKDTLEKFIKTFKETAILFWTYEFQIEMLKELVDCKKVECLIITHEDRTEELYNGK